MNVEQIGAKIYRPHVFAQPARLVDPPNWTGHLPFAFWLTEALAPRVFVELGTHTGTSYCGVCQTIKSLGLATACYAVDTWQGDPQAGFYGDQVFEELRSHHDPLYGGFSRLVRATFDEAAAQFADASIDLLHIDGLHTYDAVRHDFETWRPKLSERAVVLFHDTNVREGDFGVWKLWDEVSGQHPSFSFLHAHGLGVLGVGRALPDRVRWLFEAAAEPSAAQAIRETFARIGGQLILPLALQRERAENARLTQAVAEQHALAARMLYERDMAQSLADQRAADLEVTRQWVADRDRAITERDHQLAGLHAHVAAIETERQAVHASALWKAALLIRRITRAIPRLSRLSARAAGACRLEPLNDVLDHGGQYESTGPDPSFLIHTQAPLRGRWCELTCGIEGATMTVAPTLYTDSGEGFREDTAQRLPVGPAGTIHCLVWLPARPKALRFDPADAPGRFTIRDFTIRPLGPSEIIGTVCGLRRRNRRAVLDAARRLLTQGWSGRIRHTPIDLAPHGSPPDYSAWLARHGTPGAAEWKEIEADVASLPNRPLISLLLTGDAREACALERTLASLREQIYPAWELCVLGPHGADAMDGLRRLAPADARVHRGPAEQARGDFVAVVGVGDVLAPHALYVIARAVIERADVDIVYTDEDRLDRNGGCCDPVFKPDWSPDLMLGRDAVGRLAALRRTLVEQAGGYRPAPGAVGEHDLILRVSERTSPARIHHVPHVLYHRADAPAPAGAADATRRAVAEHLARRGVVARVEPLSGAEPFCRVIHPLPAPAPLVSLIIPTRDKVDLLRRCVDGLLYGTDYPNLEVLIIDNSSVEAETRAYFTALADEPRVRVLPYDHPFNYSAINNFGVAQAKGSLIGLINNDIAVIRPDWLVEMAAHALRPEVGAVGAKLLYANDTIQHAGVVTGVHGVAGHVFRHAPRAEAGPLGRLRLTQNLSCVTAACLLMRKQVYTDVGGLDAVNLPVSYNDVDLCLRLRLRGYLVVWTPFAELYHLESVSRGADTEPHNQARAIAEMTWMQNRWGAQLTADPYYNPNLTLDSEDCGLAGAPRVAPPWRRPAETAPCAGLTAAA